MKFSDHRHSLRAYPGTGCSIKLGHGAFYNIESGRTDEIQFSHVQRRVENSEKQKNLTLKRNYFQTRESGYPFYPSPPWSPVIEVVKEPPTGGQIFPFKTSEERIFARYEFTVTP